MSFSHVAVNICSISWGNMSVSAFSIGRRSWTQEELNFFSDVIATGTLLETKELDPVATRPAAQDAKLPEIETETTFLISQSFKGTLPQNAKVVVRHSPLPGAGSETAPGQTNRYLLYLKKDHDNSFEPTSGKITPVISIRLDLAETTAKAEDT